MHLLICGVWGAASIYFSWSCLKHHHFKLCSSTRPAPGPVAKSLQLLGWQEKMEPTRAGGCPHSQERGLWVAGSNCWQRASHKGWGAGGSGSLSCPIPRHRAAHAGCECFGLGEILVKAVQFGVPTKVSISLCQISPSHSTSQLLRRSYFARK